MDDPYSYPARAAQFALTLDRETNGWRRYRVEFPTGGPTRYFTADRPGRGELYRPSESGRRPPWPLVVLVHGWGDHSLLPCRMLARALVRRGIACFLPHLVLHSSRMPANLRAKGIRLAADEWFEAYQTSVIDVRQTLDWAAGEKDIDIRRVGIVGLSLGGIVSAIAMGVDERIKSGVFLVTGGDYEHPAWSKGRRASGDTAAPPDHEEYARYLTEVASHGFQNVTPSKSSYLTDPVTFAGNLRDRPVLMINALWDASIPKEGTCSLWEACGEPEIRWLPGNHVSIWLLYPIVRRQVVAFIRSSMGL